MIKNLLWCVTLLVAGCFSDSNDKIEKDKILSENIKKMENEILPLTVTIPSFISKNTLEITAPRCFFKINVEKYTNKIMQENGIGIIFPLSYFSDQPNYDYKNNFKICPKNTTSTVVHITRIIPINNEPIEYKNYFLKNKWFFYSFYEKNEKISLYKSGPGGKLAFFINQSKESMEDMVVNFWPNSTGNPTFPSQIDVSTVFKKNYKITYTIYATPILKDLTPPLRGPQSADNLLNIYHSGDNILNHPEIVNGFIKINNNIINSLNKISIVK